MDHETSNISYGLVMASLVHDPLDDTDRPMTEAEKEKRIFERKDAEREKENNSPKI